MESRSKNLWFKANKKPVGLGEAMEIKEAYKGREVDIIRVGTRYGASQARPLYAYNVYVRRKGK